MTNNTNSPAAGGPLDSLARRSRNPLKVPKFALAPSTNWLEQPGLRRAIAVLKTEASLLRREGLDNQAKALRRVAAALDEADRSTTGEAHALDWARRDEALD